MVSLNTVFPNEFPSTGAGDDATAELFDALIDEHSAALGDPLTFAHMDPPASAVAARVVGRNALTNQNLLHPDLSPLARVAETKAIDWLAPLFGMQDGLMCSGSSVANLTALWCARESGAVRVVGSVDAHLSIAKSAHLLGLPFYAVPVDSFGRMQIAATEVRESDCVVLTAGTTGRGAIDPLQTVNSRWLHVDAAWAGPLQLTAYANRLSGIEQANSVALSAHKWLFQPKDSALVFFKDAKSRELISFGGAYLATPNVGIQGSRSAAGLALLATLMSEGKSGLAAIIEKCMKDAEKFASYVQSHNELQLKSLPETGVVNWRPENGDVSTAAKALGLTSSTVTIDGEIWLRQVAANPSLDIGAVIEKIDGL